MRLIAHVDADCFYVSCERVRDASLIGVPVGVLGNQGACVIAKSYEMKPSGVTVGMPIWQAKKLCPEGIYVKRDFEWYEVISRQMQAILKTYSEALEFYSVDESFLDLGDYNGDPVALGHEMQNHILREVKVPVSVGLGPTRILAKIGSDKNKPFGVAVASAENLEDFLETTPVREIHGIGARLSERLIGMGIKTALDYVNTPRETILKLLHKPGEIIWYELRGKSLVPVHTEHAFPKTLSRGGGLWGSPKDPKVIYGFLIRNFERWIESIWLGEIQVLNVGLVLVDTKGGSVSAEHSFSDYTDDYFEIQTAFRLCFKKLYRRGEAYSAMHLYSTILRPAYSGQSSLFYSRNDRAEDVKKLKLTLQKRFGGYSLRSASTAYTPEVFADPANNYEICDIRGKTCF